VRRGSIVRISIYSVIAGIFASLVAVLVPWLPTSASEEMDRIEFTFWFTTVICVAVFAVVAAVIAYSVLKFRVQPDDESDGPPIHGHTGVEIVWTAIPAILVTAISIVSAIVLAKNDDAGPNPIRIAVTAQQFAWKFEYPGGKRVAGELVLPVNQAAKLTLHSLDVIHAFWVPEFGQKSDAVPGIETTLVITPNRKGEFAVICTELCGLGHATMRAPVRVVDQAEYEKFLAAGGAAGGVAESSGKSIFTTAGCGGCHTFTPAGSDAQVGPSLDSVDPGSAPLAEFLRTSIVDPNAHLAPGYQPDVMPTNYGKTLSDEQLDALVQYLAEGQKK
jgi:cytochrome c oxidase subunit 2